MYLKKHPETARGGLPGKAGGGKAKNAEVASFAADTAGKTGRSERSVQVDAQIGDSIPDDVFEAIAGSPPAPA